MSVRLLTAALALGLIVVGRAVAAPPDDRILAVDQYTSEKARTLARKYAPALRDLNAGIYHCLPWLEVSKESIGFFRPKHLVPSKDDRYLSLRIYVDQETSPQFASLKMDGRAAAMFSRYMVDGFTVIVHWLKPTIEAGAQPVNETIAAFIERSVVADYLAGRARASDLASRATVLGFDGKTALGRLSVSGWEDDFVKTFQIANYRLEPGVTCR
ncbi:MAG: hypothetical protein AUJ05_13250 [Candidatus Rokubacteria bacterium 13_1_40CM_3_69_38]|nr:MAG: hypothetical protein AUJ05_13250 [Candidatus Rokubacteria bacterium 13_1_40CM_3_69_38]